VYTPPLFLQRSLLQSTCSSTVSTSCKRTIFRTLSCWPLLNLPSSKVTTTAGIYPIQQQSPRRAFSPSDPSPTAFSHNPSTESHRLAPGALEPSARAACPWASAQCSPTNNSARWPASGNSARAASQLQHATRCSGHSTYIIYIYQRRCPPSRAKK
jgi:hypothetical protein